MATRLSNYYGCENWPSIKIASFKHMTVDECDRKCKLHDNCTEFMVANKSSPYYDGFCQILHGHCRSDDYDDGSMDSYYDLYKPSPKEKKAKNEVSKNAMKIALQKLQVRTLNNQGGLLIIL